ncbi:MAG: tRNA lysidine(34) synthetase TilS [Pseudomonadota bacterium]
MLIDTDIYPGLIADFSEAVERLWPTEFREGRLGLAVSGGPDSLALLLIANAAMTGEIAVASVDHGLRAEAAGEVALVEKVCRGLGVPFTALSVTVEPGNLQAQAREARYDALGAWAIAEGLGAVATAHHADDQAETLLMRLARGSGLSGLAGVRSHGVFPGTHLPLIRPLLDKRKSVLQSVVDRAGIQAVQDPSNHDDRFDRVRVRKHLADHDWLGVENLAESAGHLAEAWRAIEWFAQEDWETQVFREDDGFKYYANVPRVVAIETICRAVADIGRSVSRGDAGRAFDRLWREQNASLGGVLVTPGVERVEKAGVTMRVWRFAPEPPRRTH